VSTAPSASDQTWPTALWIVRHGQSAGNVARDAAEAAGLAQIEIAHRDVDVPLSDLGERQALALGRWFAEMPAAQRPTVVLASPYLRAVQTSKRVIDAGGLGSESLAYVVDERLREKEFGRFDRLTKAGIVARFPEEALRRDELGKFYYRPPSGESWCDVILRLRSVLDDLQLQYRGERVLIVAHQVIVLCFRYLLEKLDEKRILDIDTEKDVANCGVTAYAFTRDAAGRGQLALTTYNFVSPLEEAGTPVTQAPDATVPKAEP
jgi:2,3-bisphosphoglycerate-dependent phosphoglycerate mutase